MLYSIQSPIPFHSFQPGNGVDFGEGSMVISTKGTLNCYQNGSKVGPLSLLAALNVSTGAYVSILNAVGSPYKMDPIESPMFKDNPVLQLTRFLESFVNYYLAKNFPQGSPFYAPAFKQKGVDVSIQGKNTVVKIEDVEIELMGIHEIQ